MNSNIDEIRGDRTDLLVTVASLYYELNQNQQQIADRLEISRSSVSRMIKEARDQGIVEIRIHKPVNRDYALEQALIDHFGLQDAYVLLTHGDKREEENLWGVGRLAAGYFQRVIESLPLHACIGIAWGTGVYAAINALPEDRTRQIDVVQIIGSVGAPDPLIDGPDLARMAAAKLGGRHYDLHAPVLGGAADPAQYALRRTCGERWAGSGACRGPGDHRHRHRDPAASSFLRAGHLTPADLSGARRGMALSAKPAAVFLTLRAGSRIWPSTSGSIGIGLDDLEADPARHGGGTRPAQSDVDPGCVARAGF